MQGIVNFANPERLLLVNPLVFFDRAKLWIGELLSVHTRLTLRQTVDYGLCSTHLGSIFKSDARALFVLHSVRFPLDVTHWPSVLGLQQSAATYRDVGFGGLLARRFGLHKDRTVIELVV